MPHFQLSNGAKAFYEFYGSDDAEHFDREKPTIALLPPTLGYPGVLDAYYTEPELAAQYNFLALEPSVCPGRTVAVPDARYDSFVAAAELALILQSLQLPAVHIFAPEQHSALITLCLATAFPDHVASATVVGVPPLNNPDDQTYWEEEVVAAHLNPFEPDAWSELITGYVNYQYELDQGHAPCDVVDKLVDADARACTHRPEAVISWWATTLERDFIAAKAFKHVHCDVLFVQSVTDDAEDLATQCLGQTPAEQYKAVNISDAPPSLGLAQPMRVLPIFKEFLRGLDNVNLAPIITDMKAAHQRLCSLLPDNICSDGQDPHDPFSFSSLNEASIERFERLLAQASAIKEENQGSTCALPFGQGKAPWDVKSVDDLSASWSRRHEGETLGSERRGSGVEEITVGVDSVSC